jgi:hypothetical protein
MKIQKVLVLVYASDQLPKPRRRKQKIKHVSNTETELMAVPEDIKMV